MARLRQSPGSPEDCERLRFALRRDFPDSGSSSDRAWSRAAALRVIDCVLSLRRNYDRFLVPRLDAFEKRFPRVTSSSQLRALIDSYESPAAFAKDALDYNDAQRAVTLSRVVDYVLSIAGPSDSDSELQRLRTWAEQAPPELHKALGIRGFGLAGWQYLRMLFGANTTKPDVHICRYVANAVGHEVTALQALHLLEDAVRNTSMSLRDMDTTIWEHSARDVPKTSSRPAGQARALGGRPT